MEQLAEFFQLTSVWYGVFFCISIIAFFILIPFTKSLVDRGYGLSKLVGLLGLAGIYFQGNLAHIIPFSRSSATLLVLILTAVALIVWYKNRDSYTGIAYRWIVVEELLFIATFLLYAYAKYLGPSLNDVEKYMNSGIIHSWLRTEYGPPLDMWYAGSVVNYYYFGHFLSAMLIQLTGIVPVKGFNLFTPTITAIAVIQVFSMALNFFAIIAQQLEKKIGTIALGLFAFLTTAAVNFSTNLSLIYVFGSAKYNTKLLPIWQVWSGVIDLNNLEKYYYPISTRMVLNSINEMPSYSHVIGDSHGHSVSIVIALLALFCIGVLVVQLFAQAQKENQKKLALTWQAILLHKTALFTAIIGVLIGFAYMTSASDVLVYTLLVGLVLLVFARTWARKVYLLLLYFITLQLTIFQFSLKYHSFVSSVGVNCSPDWLIKIKSFWPFVFEPGKCSRTDVYTFFLMWGTIFIAAAALTYFISKKTIAKSSAVRASFILVLLGVILVCIPEFFYFKDIYDAHFRANTMFKLGYHAFVFGSIGLVTALWVGWIYHFDYPQKWQKNVSRVLVSIGVVLVTLLSLYMPIALYQSVFRYGEYRTFDGKAWLNKTMHGDYGIVDFMNTIPGQPTIVEAFSESYERGGRISIYTGLPTIIEWRTHERLWRGDMNAVQARISDVQSLYTTVDVKIFESLIKKYQVAYIVVGNYERKQYPQLNENMIAFFGDRVYHDPQHLASVYKIR